ncbi:hypothetical protein CHLNCDRAFT_140417, partial [Chlorella variabilis]
MKQLPRDGQVELSSLLPHKAQDSACAPLPDALEQDKDIAGFQGYRSPLYRQILFWALCVLTGGLLFLLSRWFMRLRVLLALVPCPLAQAEYVVVTLVDRHEDLVRVQKMASFSSISIQANGSASLSLSASSSHHHHHHVLSEDESPIASPTVAATAPLKGGDGYDRLLEYRCGRYLYHHAQATFLPVPDMPHDFAATLHTVAGSRNIK